MRLRVLTWNLFHGRSAPPTRRELLPEFAAALGGWEWDVALLQEVPPWWPPQLAARLGADARAVLTSRNALLPLRRAAAIRFPNVLKANGGGANAILVRSGRVAGHRSVRLCRLPERRWMHAVRREPGGVWIANVHLSGNHRAAAAEAARAGAALDRWAQNAPAILGGDFNLRSPVVDGFAYGGGHYVDHVLVSGDVSVDGARMPPSGALSDHRPVTVAVEFGEMSLAA